MATKKPVDVKERKLPEIPEADKLIMSMGLIIRNSLKSWWLSKSDTKQALADSFAFLEKALEVSDELSLKVVEGNLTVNAVHLELKEDLLKTFVDRLEALEINHLVFTRGATFPMFEKFMMLLILDPDDVKKAGGPTELIKQEGITNIESRTVIFREVTGDELIVSREKLAAEGLDPQAVVDNIVAYLGGKDGLDAETVKKSMRSAAADPKRMAEIILKAVEAHKKLAEGGAAPNEVADSIVDCLKKTFDSLSGDPAAKTQKGKAGLSRVLTAMEEDLLARVQEKFGKLDEKSVSAISQTLGGMKDELTIDSLAADYMKKRDQVGDNEDRILRFIRAKGWEKIHETDLRERLADGGLSLQGWQDLLIKSGVIKGMGESRGEFAVGNLAMLIDKMEHRIIATAGEAGVDKAKRLADILIEVNQEVESLVEKTTTKIDGLAREISDSQGSADDNEEVAQKITKKRLLEIMAEIVQELGQPLSVVKCSLDMLQARSLGDINRIQLDVVDLASESTRRMQKMMKNLLQIVGLPLTMTPDKAIQESLHKD